MWKTCANEKFATRSVSSSSTFSGVHQTVWTDARTTRTAAAIVAAGSSARLVRGGSERLHLGRLGCSAVRMLLDHVGLVVDALRVHFPDVMVRAVEVVDRAHRGEHRVVGVV